MTFKFSNPLLRATNNYVSSNPLLGSIFVKHQYLGFEKDRKGLFGYFLHFDKQMLYYESLQNLILDDFPKHMLF